MPRDASADPSPGLGSLHADRGERRRTFPVSNEKDFGLPPRGIPVDQAILLERLPAP